MTAIVSGIYATGKIELLEIPVGIRDGNVRVIVIDEDEFKQPSTQMQFGKYSSGRHSTEEDFTVAEWHGEKEWGNGDGE